jgi:hypothetical protein
MNTRGRLLTMRRKGSGRPLADGWSTTPGTGRAAPARRIARAPDGSLRYPGRLDLLGKELQ